MEQDTNTMTDEELQATLDAMRTAERGIAYRLARVKAVIDKHRFSFFLQGAKEPFEERRTLEGQIVAGIILRHLYREKIDHPLCSSVDGGVSGMLHEETILKGIDLGIPDGQLCSQCPYNMFGSASSWEERSKDSRGKACKEKRALAMLIPGVEGAVVVSLPTTSMGAWDSYAQGLDMLGDSYIKQQTRISLEVVTKGSNSYGVAKFESMGHLERGQVVQALRDKQTIYVPMIAAQARVEATLPQEVSRSMPDNGVPEAPPLDEAEEQAAWDSRLDDE